MASLLPPPEGYPKLAYEMGAHPENAILRRFSNLNVQNLLYLQAELVHLEKELREYEVLDTNARESNRCDYARDWYWLSTSAESTNDAQIQTVTLVQKKLKEYNGALMQQVAMAALPQPNQYDLKSLLTWLERPGLGNRALIGTDRNVWGSTESGAQHALDLMVLKARQSEDTFSKLVMDKLLLWFRRCLGYRFKKHSDVESGVVNYEENNLLHVTSFITTLIASALPVLSIVILYNIQSMGVRLGAITILTVLFSFCLKTFTVAKRIDCFVASATFAAVQVVFVSTSSTACQQ